MPLWRVQPNKKMHINGAQEVDSFLRLWLHLCRLRSFFMFNSKYLYLDQCLTSPWLPFFFFFFVEVFVLTNCVYCSYRWTIPSMKGAVPHWGKWVCVFLWTSYCDYELIDLKYRITFCLVLRQGLNLEPRLALNSLQHPEYQACKCEAPCPVYLFNF